MEPHSSLSYATSQGPRIRDRILASAEFKYAPELR